MPHGASVIGCVRVSTDEQGELGFGLDAQGRVILEGRSRRGWHVLLETDTLSGRDLNRPGLRSALTGAGPRLRPRWPRSSPGSLAVALGGSLSGTRGGDHLGQPLHEPLGIVRLQHDFGTSGRVPNRDHRRPVGAILAGERHLELAVVLFPRS